ncbi:MAG: hypothetical protein IPJ19_20965 [Planctomycetes bacterium]|nr:hypothetical protein [Planctomycetota bacterium]
MQAEPGAGFSVDYSWLPLPLVIERASKRSFNDCLAQEICVPPGLRETQVRTELAGAEATRPTACAVEQARRSSCGPARAERQRARTFSTGATSCAGNRRSSSTRCSRKPPRTSRSTARSQDGTAPGANACF